jgi:hypothetical protein
MSERQNISSQKTYLETLHSIFSGKGEDLFMTSVGRHIGEVEV